MKPLVRIVLCLLVAHTNIAACGYDFIGGCATHIRLKINGTEGNFAVSECVSEPAFQGLQLGNLRTLVLSGGSMITWESCINNITSGAIYYRIYPSSQSGGTWSNLNVPEDYNTIEGPYTTRYRNASSNINLANGLTVGANYTMEIYVRVEADTIGDDFIPETFLLNNNSGANYKLNFTYGGPNAPALTTVVTQKENIDCWGKSTGLLGVSVFGTQTGGTLFYQWSAFSENFFKIDSLPAGTYTVTVTESPSGNTSTRSAQITQPQFPISLSFSNVTPASCNMSGTATVHPTGGTGALTWEWSTGDTTQTAFFPVSGIYAITVTDAKACTQKGMVNIGGAGSATIFEYPVICEGQTYTRGGQNFTQSGLYSAIVPAPNGCDSIINFYLTVVEGAGLLNAVPTTGTIGCALPTISVCASTGASAYAWTLDGVPVGNGSPCIDVTAVGNYEIVATTIANGKVCLFAKTVVVAGNFTPPMVSAEGVGTYLQSCYTGNIQVIAKAITSPTITEYQWFRNGNLISNIDSCIFTVQPPLSNLGNLSLKVTDIFGCQNEISNITINVPNATLPPTIQGALQQTNCDGTINALLQTTGGLAPLSVQWSSLGVTGNPVTLMPGFNNVEVRDAAGCTASVFVIIEDFSIQTQSTAATGATEANGQATVQVKGAANLPFTVLWDNGATTTTVNDLLPGTYCVTVSDNTGCTRTACAVVDFTSSTTQPFVQSGGLGIRPNPATAGTDIQVNTIPWEATWALVNLQGIVCDEQALQPMQNTVSIPPNLPDGLYFIFVKTNKFLYTDKIFLKNER